MWGEQTLEAKVEALRTRRFAEVVQKQGLGALKHVMGHKWAWPFKEPVDAEKLGLTDYHKIISRPMDLGTVKTRVEGGYYTHPDDLAADIRLVFENARTFNPPTSDVHIMAATLSEAFEGRWQASVQPKIAEAAAACAAEAKKAGQRAAEAERQRVVEGAENKCRELERHLEARGYPPPDISRTHPAGAAVAPCFGCCLLCMIAQLTVAPFLQTPVSVRVRAEGGGPPDGHRHGPLPPLPAAHGHGEAPFDRRAPPPRARGCPRCRPGARESPLPPGYTPPFPLFTPPAAEGSERGN